ncbi:hypothetical protein MKX03_003371 [Papaver bracteatum]|nr:hypothetical protein MKX03_003371 [Papaver bracteatum]
MAKMSMFVCFFLFVLIAMPASSSGRMMLEEVLKVGNKCAQCFAPCRTIDVRECANGWTMDPCCCVICRT